MIREQLAHSIKRDCALIESLFARKNQSYGANEDAFYNFTKGAELLYDEPPMRRNSGH